MTLEWPRPEGRVEIYIVRWWATDHENDVHQLNVTQPPEVLDSLSSSANNVRVLIGELIPGIEYTFQIRTVSYNLESDVTILSARTSKLEIFFKFKLNYMKNFFSATNSIGSCGR